MGNASSELQHIANALQLMGPEEKKFMEAVLHGRLLAARQLLQDFPNVIYARTKMLENAWHLAAFAGNLEMLEVLQKDGVGTRKPLPGEPLPVNHRTRMGFTPLMVAVQKGHEKAMQFLLAAGAEVRLRDNYGNTCVHYAALLGRTKMLELLLALSDAEEEGTDAERGLEILEKARHFKKAAHLTNVAVAQIDEITSKVVSVARTFGAAAAAQLGAEGLHGLATGRYVDLRNEAGLQPLHFAVWGGYVETAKLLLQYGANLAGRSGSDSVAEVTCNGGSTPLHIAALRDNCEMVWFLLEQYVRQVEEAPSPYMAPYDIRKEEDNYGYTPYMLAKNLKRTDVLPMVDKRAVLPSIDRMKLAAGLRRQQTLRGPRILRMNRTSSTGGERGEETTSYGQERSEDWDPFGTGVMTRPYKVSKGSHDAALPVPKLKPPPKPRVGLGSKGAGIAEAANGAAGSSGGGEAVPAEFVCPLTKKVMGDPVTAKDGRNYERDAIEMWVGVGNPHYPDSEVKASDKHKLTANEKLKARIEEWKARPALPATPPALAEEALPGVAEAQEEGEVEQEMGRGEIKAAA